MVGEYLDRAADELRADAPLGEVAVAARKTAGVLVALRLAAERHGHRPPYGVLAATGELHRWALELRRE
jgi:hypothetical protein